MRQVVKAVGNQEKSVELFLKEGAIKWSQPILRLKSKWTWDWLSNSQEMLTRPTVQRSYPPLQLPQPLIDFLCKCFESMREEKGYYRYGTQDLRLSLSPRQNNQDKVEIRDNGFNWHTDSFDAISLIIPLTPFTWANGCSEICVGSHLVPWNQRDENNHEKAYFVAEVGQPLLLHSLCLHRRRHNATSEDRVALITQVDRTSFPKPPRGLF